MHSPLLSNAFLLPLRLNFRSLVHWSATWFPSHPVCGCTRHFLQVQFEVSQVGERALWGGYWFTTFTMPVVLLVPL
jgi:hypothetical protein